MRTTFPLALLFLAATSTAIAQTSDLPNGNDMRDIHRPANSFLIGAMHSDRDEYAVPIGPVARGNQSPAKSVTVTGPIDTVAYAGPQTTSSFATYDQLHAQVIAQGYTEVWSCIRTTCGSAFTLANILDKPLIDAVHDRDYGFYLNDDLNATNDDTRYGAFRKGDTYLLIMASLQPGKPSGSLIVRVNGPADDIVYHATTAVNGTTETPATTTPSASSARTRIRSLLGR